MISTVAKTISLREFLELEETRPYSEYIEQEIIQKPMPQGKHSRIQIKLTSAINLSLESSQIGLAFPELRCTFENRSIVPDIAVFQWSHIPIDRNGNLENIFTIPPDWIIEILSPDQAQAKVTRKILHCLEYGSDMGWLIEPGDEYVTVYQRTEDGQITVRIFERTESILVVPNFARGIQLTVGDLFGWIKL
jgi:Uma2 family endonuclease